MLPTASILGCSELEPAPPGTCAASPNAWGTTTPPCTLAWSNEAVEGHIGRLKTIKRQMYGRAGLALLG